MIKNISICLKIVDRVTRIFQHLIEGGARISEKLEKLVQQRRIDEQTKEQFMKLYFHEMEQVLKYLREEKGKIEDLEEFLEE